MSALSKTPFTKELRKKLCDLANEFEAAGVTLIAHAAGYTAKDVSTVTVFTVKEVPEASCDHQYADAVVKIGMEWFNHQHKSKVIFRPGRYANQKGEPKKHGKKGIVVS